MNAPLESVLSEVRLRLQAVFGPRLDRLILFGSRARGDAEPDSDIDVMIILKDPVDDRGPVRDRYMKVAADLSLEFETVIMPFLTDAHTYASSDFSIYLNIRREGVTI
jgi:predicted nucleotidyltransferase